MEDGSVTVLWFLSSSYFDLGVPWVIQLHLHLFLGPRGPLIEPLIPVPSRPQEKSRSPLQPYKSSQDHCQPIKREKGKRRKRGKGEKRKRNKEKWKKGKREKEKKRKKRKKEKGKREKKRKREKGKKKGEK